MVEPQLLELGQLPDGWLELANIIMREVETDQEGHGEDLWENEVEIEGGEMEHAAVSFGLLVLSLELVVLGVIGVGGERLVAPPHGRNGVALAVWRVEGAEGVRRLHDDGR